MSEEIPTQRGQAAEKPRTAPITRLGYLAAIPLFFLLVWALTHAIRPQESVVAAANGLDGTPSFLPLIQFIPTPTPVPTATPFPLPAVLGEVPLTEALCPNYVGVNPVSGMAYVPNNGNNTLSIVQETNHLKTVAFGNWPGRVGVDPNGTRAFITYLRDSNFAIWAGDSFFATFPTYGESFDVVYNPVNHYIYVSDLFSRISIYDGDTNQLVETVNLASGWVLGLAVDTNTGLVYAANWELGNVFIIDGTQQVGMVPVGWGVLELAVNPNNGYVYGAHSAPSAQYPNNISIIKDGQLVKTFTTATRSMDVAVDPVTGYAYFANEDNDTVTVVQGETFIATIPVGARPWSVAVNPESGYVFVANRDDNTISVIRGAVVVATLPGGAEPFAVAVDEAHDLTYVANRASRVVCNPLDQCEEVCDPNASVTVIR